MKRFYRSLIAVSIMVTAAVTASAAGTGIVDANGGLRLRSGASTDTSTLAIASNGASVSVVSKEGDWYKVIYNNQTGYMHGDYLNVTEAASSSGSNVEGVKSGIGIVKANSGLRLRESASTSSAVLATARNGSNVVIIDKENGWYKVIYNLKTGYMSADYLEVKDRENVDLGEGEINSSLVNIRSGPSTGNTLVDQASKGEKVDIFGFNCGWYKVKYNGQVGYIRSDLVDLTEVPPANNGSASSDNGSSSGGSSDSGSSETPSTPSAPSDDYDSSSLGAQIAAYAQKFVGYPYVYGGTTPSGFDCSGFVQYIYRQFSVSINRTATAQLANGYSVSYDSLRPGDLVFFGSGSYASHVGMYIGGGQFVHAQGSATGVVISNLTESWYLNRYIGARRIVD